ncbi:MAG TPA: hypothetical protein PK349_08335 [Candidatus Hydrogenedentes bacterium]|nr:hypothetical protein [Candidatus Hydrogenedentota bacterium]
MKRILAFWCGLVVTTVLSTPGMTQPPTDPSSPPPPSAQASPEGTPSEGTSAPTGDYVVLKNGKQLNNIYIVRVTPLTVEIGYSPEKADLKIPRKQVQEIHQAGKIRQSGESETKPAQEETTAFPAAELDSTFHQKLTTPLPETPLTYENQDITKILSELAIKADVALEIADDVKQLPESKRQVSVTVNRGTTLAEFLHQELSKIVPGLQVKFDFDHVIITSRGQ